MRNLILFLTVSLLLFSSCKQQQYVTAQSDSSSIGITSEKIDSSFVKDIEPYKQKLDAEMNTVIGRFEKELIVNDFQSTLGNFIIDLILQKSKEYYGQKIDVALVTKGGLRTPIPKGEVTTGNIFELMPFENELVVLKMKGSTLYKVFEYGAKRGNVYLSGAKYEIKGEKPQNILIGDKPLDINKEYSIVLSDYLAGGGDKLTFMNEATEYIQLGNMFRDAIIEYIKEQTAKGKILDANLDDRVVIFEN